jgi:O-succinylbenzoate synthase
MAELDTELDLANLHILQIPLRNTFRGINTREVAVFQGPQGWSEFSPFLEYDDRESLTWLRAALTAAQEPWPHLYRTKIAINATLPAVTPEKVPSILARFAGCTTVKIKVDDFVNGAALVAATLDLLPEARIRLDVNGGWNYEQALSHLTAYHSRFGEVFEYVEQPSPLVADLKRLHAQSPIKIAADESIRKNLDGDLHEIKEFADVAILKWQPLGGITAAHEIATTIGLPVVVSSALETGVGISHGLALAASLPTLDFACGLGTTSLFESDICGEEFIVQDGYLEVTQALPLDIERYAASADRRQWWQNRIMKVAALL